MISKEKQILIESYDKRNLNYKNTKSIMDKMLNYRLGELKKSRNEEYSKKVQEWKKENSFDMNNLGYNQKERISPTSRSDVRSFRNLHEQRLSEWDIELKQIKEELE